MSVICFVIHGIGSQDQSFSEPLQKGVHRKLVKLIKKKAKDDPANWATVEAAKVVDFESLYWANIESDEQNNLYRQIYPELFGTENSLKKFFQLGTTLAPVRSLSVRLIGDVFGYLGRFQEKIKRQVFSQLVAKLGPRVEAGKPFSIILIGHSLGSVILHDIISGFLRYRYAGFDSMVGRISVFTMGSPLSLFSLAAESANPDKFAKWVNFLHSRDPVAQPMAGIFPTVEDVELWDMSLNLLALHSEYWHNGKVHKRIAQEIIEHCDKGFVVPFSPGPLGTVPPEIFQAFHGGAAKAGFSDHFDDFQSIPFAKLIPGAKEIDICNVYARTWTKENTDYFIKALGNPETTIRVCMLSPDSPSLPGFCYHFNGMAPDELKKRIEATTSLYERIVDQARKRFGTIGTLKIYYCLNIVNHSLYRFDDAIYFVPRPTISDDLAAKPIPALVYRDTSKTTDFFSWLMKDFNLLLKTEHDAVPHFDSADQQQDAGPAA